MAKLIITSADTETTIPVESHAEATIRLVEDLCDEMDPGSWPGVLQQWFEKTGAHREGCANFTNSALDDDWVTYRYDPTVTPADVARVRRKK